MLTVFENEGFQVRTVTVADKTFFVAADLAEPLGLSNRRMTQKWSELDEDERGRRKISTLGGEQTMNVVTEPGFISLILSCPKSRNKNTAPWRYRRWVTHDVLPAIHKTGEYKLKIAHLTKLLAAVTTERDKLSVGVAQKVKAVLGFPTDNTRGQWRVVMDVMRRLKAASLTENGPDRVVFRLPVEETIREALPLIRRHLPEAGAEPGWKQSSLKNYFGEK